MTINKMLKMIKGNVVKQIKKTQWIREAKRLVEEDSILDAIEIKNNEIKNVLVIAPHADDELIGCYEILKKGGRNVDLYYTGLTGYDTTKENRSVRKNEIKECSKLCGNVLYYDNAGETQVLRELLSRNYSTVFIPSFVDWHWEHRKVCRNTLSCLLENNYSGDVFFYAVTVPIPSKYVNAFSLASKEKWKDFDKIYVSQSFMPINRFKAVEISYYTDSNMKIEPYIKIGHNDIKALLVRFALLDEEELNQLENNINKLIEVRKMSTKYYDILNG